MLHRSIVIGVGSVAAATIGVAAFASSNQTHHTTAGSTGASAVVRAETASVNGKTESILTNAQGLPLYYYGADTASASRVDGALAISWPALTSSGTPVATGVRGHFTVVGDTHGSQVAYNGHLLYTFVSDSAGTVTGQGVDNFSVATPTTAALSGSSSRGNTSMYSRGAY